MFSVKKRFTFPGGEEHVQIYLNYDRSVTFRIENSSDVMALFLSLDAAKRAGSSHINLVLPYIPYARQDRVAVPGEALSIAVFAQLLNTFNLSSVTVWDPHSDVSTALINNCRVTTQAQLIEQWDNKPEFMHHALIVCPDAGARKKTYEVAKAIGADTIIMADKHRDTATGVLSSPVVMTMPTHSTSHSPLLIVDDICDGGGTFIALAGALKDAGYKGDINLYVTHGIFSRGIQPLIDAGISHIYAANIWSTVSPHEGLTCTIRR